MIIPQLSVSVNCFSAKSEEKNENLKVQPDPRLKNSNAIIKDSNFLYDTSEPGYPIKEKARSSTQIVNIF